MQTILPGKEPLRKLLRSIADGTPIWIWTRTECRIQDVKLDGNKVIVLYSFAQAVQMYLSENPTAAVWRLEPGGYFVIDRMGTDVIRDYWLTE